MDFISSEGCWRPFFRAALTYLFFSGGISAPNIEEEEKRKRKYCLSYHLDRVSSLACLLSRSFEIAFAGDMVGDMAKFLEAFEFLEEEIKLIKVKAEEELSIAIDKI